MVMMHRFYALFLVLVVGFCPAPAARAAYEDAGSRGGDKLDETNPAVLYASPRPEPSSPPEGPDVPGDRDPVLDEISARDMDVREAVEIIARKSGLNIITGQDVSGRTTIFLRNVRARDALRMVLESNGLAYAEEGGLIRIMPQKEYLARFGHAFGQDKVTRMFKLHFVAGKDLLAVLNGLKSPEGKIIFDEDSRSLVVVDTLEKVRSIESLIRDVDVETVTTDIPLEYIRADEVLEEARGLLTQSVGSVQSDAAASKLVVTDTPAVIERIRRAVSQKDASARKVVLEVRLVHIALNDEYLGGVDWEAIVEDYRTLRLPGRYDFVDGVENRPLSLGVIAREDFPTLLEALDTVGIVQEYPPAELVVTRNETVKLTVNFDEPGLSAAGSADDGVSFGADFAPSSRAMLDLFVKLSVGPDNRVEALIFPAESRRKEKPSFSKKRWGCTFVEDGSMLVMGGLVATEKIAVNRKIPLMGDLPLVGFVFRFQNSSVRREEFVIFLTPRVAGQEPLPLSTPLPAAKEASP